ncbi:MAG: DASH family cryptochrome [Planctomycetota bacterium]
MTTSLVWFRNDLRLDDNPALQAAIEGGDTVVCVYVLSPRTFGETSFGFPRIGKFRLRFLKESLENLDANLRRVGSRLRVVRGLVEEMIPKIASSVGAEVVHCQSEYGSEERSAVKRLRKRLNEDGRKLRVDSPSTMIAPDDLPFEIAELPQTFSKFRGKVEKRSDVRQPIDAPRSIKDFPRPIDGELAIEQCKELDYATIEEDSRAVMRFIGGEDAARERINEYLWEGDHLRQYKQTRNGMMGADYSSKFSAWLALGCISPRRVHAEVRRYENERVKNDDTYWMIFELLWRDFFAFTVARFGRTVFQIGGLRGERYPWKRDTEQFEAWREGRTGYPLIDANMRELAATGFMSNRGRQNVASFLTKNLGIDWRMGAEWFESLLLDYDACSNYGNWNYTAGVGNDARGFRWFNTIKQSNDYDPDGDYVKHWCTELSEVPTRYVHTPWKLHLSEQKRSQCIIGLDYPEPIVDLFKSADHHEAIYREAVGDFEPVGSGRRDQGRRGGKNRRRG